MESTDGLADVQDEANDELAPAIRMLPERLLVSEIPLSADPAEVAGAAIGSGEDDLSAVYLDLEADEPHLLVYGDSGAGKPSFLRMWMAQLAARRPAFAHPPVVLPGRARRLALALLHYWRQEYTAAYALAMPRVEGLLRRPRLCPRHTPRL
jgi:hypothetical protein